MRLPTLIASSIEGVTKRIVIIVLLQAAVKRSQEASTPEYSSPERARSGSRRSPTGHARRHGAITSSYHGSERSTAGSRMHPAT